MRCISREGKIKKLSFSHHIYFGVRQRRPDQLLIMHMFVHFFFFMCYKTFFFLWWIYSNCICARIAKAYNSKWMRAPAVCRAAQLHCDVCAVCKRFFFLYQRTSFKFKWICTSSSVVGHIRREWSFFLIFTDANRNDRARRHNIITCHCAIFAGTEIWVLKIYF